MLLYNAATEKYLQKGKRPQKVSWPCLALIRKQNITSCVFTVELLLLANRCLFVPTRLYAPVYDKVA